MPPAFCPAPPLAPPPRAPQSRRQQRAPPTCRRAAAHPPDQPPQPRADDGANAPRAAHAPNVIAAATASLALLFARAGAPAPAQAAHIPTPAHTHHVNSSVASVMSASSTSAVRVKPAKPTEPTATTDEARASAAAPQTSSMHSAASQSVATQTAPPTLSAQAVAQSSAQAVAQSKPSLQPKLSELTAAASLSARRRLALPPLPALPELPAAASGVLTRVRAARLARPAALGLVGVGAVTSTSVMVAQLSRYFNGGDENGATGEERAILARELLHNACTVVCVRIPFCVSDRAELLKGLSRLVVTQRCNDAAGMAAACRAAADVLRSQGGILEDSRKFAPHVDVFVADGLAEAERRFCGHVRMETMCADRLRRHGQTDARDDDEPDYGVVTLVVATTEGVDLQCYEDDMTNMQRLRAALDAMTGLEEGEAAGLEVVWVPGDENEQALSRSEVADAFPCLQMT